MGEYATLKRTGEQVKIGTCNEMYYCTIKQRHQVTDYEFNRGCTTMWRPPLVPRMEKGDDGFYHEDAPCNEAGDGNHTDWKYAYHTFVNNDVFWKLLDEARLQNKPGRIQLTHQCGYLINAKCYHGKELPKGGDDFTVFWNGRDPHAMRIKSIVTRGDECSVEIACKFCGESWEVSIEELERLMMYKREYRGENGERIFKDELYDGGEMLQAIKEEIADWQADKPVNPQQKPKREYVFGDTIKFNPKSK